jgi:hypothetical protein
MSEFLSLHKNKSVPLRQRQLRPWNRLQQMEQSSCWCCIACDVVLAPRECVMEMLWMVLMDDADEVET